MKTAVQQLQASKQKREGNPYNNGDLHRLFNESNQIKGGILGVLLRSRIKEFQSNNYLRYETLEERLEKLGAEYFQTEEKDGEKVIVFEGEGAERKPVMIEGKTMEDYTKAYGEIMLEPTVVII